ncbi:hypothetical protein JKI95_06660 [Corynebacterium aquatimens]|uniref:hypothetical protein n=1 Tax=Corynebacterium aquatimens TaxID=1190508 RepID=UPI002541FF7A|nr:hypothetical protein [Corynebacterium aquatimens]QYH18991.1 hypothetical protein JKI95_06660 [Corynebacterium aquatimens]
MVTETSTHELALESGESKEVDRQETWSIVSGSNLIQVRESGKKLVITANKGVAGEAVVEVADEWGNKYRYVVTVVEKQKPAPAPQPQPAPQPKPQPQPQPTPAYVTHRITIMDRQDAKITAGAGTNTLVVASESNLIFPLQPTAGGWIVAPRQGSDGLVVLEERDAAGRVVARYEITIKPAPIAEYTYKLDSTKQLELRGSGLVVVSGGELAAIDKQTGVWTIRPNEGATGTIIIEGRDERGRVEVRYTLEIKPAATPGGSVTTIIGGNADRSGGTITEIGGNGNGTNGGGNGANGNGANGGGNGANGNGTNGNGAPGTTTPVMPTPTPGTPTPAPGRRAWAARLKSSRSVRTALSPSACRVQVASSRSATAAASGLWITATARGPSRVSTAPRSPVRSPSVGAARAAWRL